MMNNSGRDWLARAMGSTDAPSDSLYGPANFMGFSDTNVPPANTDTSLEGEISGSLGRGRAVYAHTDGTSSFTLTRVAVADKAVTVYKVGLFTAESEGVMPNSLMLDTPTDLDPGDVFSHTVTITTSQI